MKVAGSARIVVDGLQYSRWNRESILQWHEGGLTCVHVTTVIWEHAREALSRLGTWNRLFAEHADLIRPVRDAEDIRSAAQEGRVGVILGFQNASPFEDDIDLVEIFHSLGVRIVQLTYNNQNFIGSSCYEPHDGGLSRFGRLVVRQMNRVGMLIDLSHVGDRTSLETIAESSRPVSITHANPRSFFEHPRNKPNDVLLRVAESGGVIGVAPYPRLTPPGTTLAKWSQMVLQLAELVGIDHVSIGTDFSEGWSDADLDAIRMGRWTREKDYGAAITPEDRGWAKWPSWFRTPAEFPQLVIGLKEVAFSDSDIAKIIGGNWVRLYGQTFRPSPLVPPSAGDGRRPRSTS